jgi:hypothetical protein
VQGMLCSDSFVLDMWAFHYRKVNKSENLLRKIKKSFQPKWFAQQSATWNGNYQAVFRAVLTKRGYGFAFNMMPGSKMFRKKLEIG